MEISIEPISPVDIGKFDDALLALHQHEIGVSPELGEAPARGDAEYLALYKQRFADWWAGGNGFGFGAFEGERPIGFVFCTEREGLAAYETGEKIGYVEEIAVVPDARGSGAGRALMDAARSEMSRRGYAWVELSTVPGNEDARAFYAHLGLAPAAVLMLGRV